MDRRCASGHDASPLFDFAMAINYALPPEYRRLTDNRREFALAIRRAHQNSKKLIG